jgi:hypothetical protein
MMTRVLDWISANGATLLISVLAFLAGMAAMLPMDGRSMELLRV